MSKKPESITELKNQSAPPPKKTMKKAGKQKIENPLYPAGIDSVVEVDLNEIKTNFGELFPSLIVDGKNVLDTQPYCVNIVKNKNVQSIYGHLIADEESGSKNKYRLHVAGIPKLEELLAKKGMSVEKCFEYQNRERTAYPNDQFPAITSDWFLFYKYVNDRPACGKTVKDGIKDQYELRKKLFTMKEVPLTTPIHALPDKQSLSKLGHAPVPEVPIKKAEKATPRKRKTAEESAPEENADSVPPKKRTYKPRKPKTVAEAPAATLAESEEKEEVEKPAKKPRTKKEKKENAKEVENPVKEEIPVAKKESGELTTFGLAFEPHIKVSAIKPAVLAKMADFEKLIDVTERHNITLSNDTKMELDQLALIVLAVEFLMEKRGITQHSFAAREQIEVPRFRMPKFKYGETIEETLSYLEKHSVNVQTFLDEYAATLQDLLVKEKAAAPIHEMVFENRTFIEIAKEIMEKDLQNFSALWHAYQMPDFKQYLMTHQKTQYKMFVLYNVLNKEDAPQKTEEPEEENFID